MRLQRAHIYAFLVFAAIVWRVVLLFQGTPVSWDHARPFTIVAAALVFVGALLERYLWRSPLLHGWFLQRPDLRGTWRVELQSSYVRPETGRPVGAIVCYMGVEQTLSRLQMHLMTPESESWFIADHIRRSPSGAGFQVIGVYTNEPNIHLRHERASEMHQGAIIIETHGPELHPTTLTAKYWTDRKTSGTMEFTERSTALATRFKDAEREFSGEAEPIATEGQRGRSS